MTTKKSFALQTLAGLVSGVLLAAAAIMLMSRGVLAFHDYLPILMAVIYVALALTVWINPYIRRTAQPGERLWKRSAATLLYAVPLAAPVLLPKSMNPVLAYMLSAVLFLASLVVMRRLLKGFDELTQRVVADTNQVTLNVLLVGLFLYGAAERLGLLPEGVSIWVLNGIVIWFHFVWSQFAWMRRGLGNPLVPEE